MSARSPSVPEGVTLHKDVVYAVVDGKKILLDLYIPSRTPGPYPVIIGIHGGGWMADSKENGPGIHLSSRGYAVACINYRLSQEAIFPAQIMDCKGVVRWLRAHARKYDLNSERFGAIGGSAGGHLSALLATSGDVAELEGNVGGNLEYSSRIQAICDQFGPTDLLKMDEARVPGSRLEHNAPTSPESRLIGGPIQEIKEKTTKANPIIYITPRTCPFLIIHGDRDPVVPPNQSQILYDALIARGVPARLHYIKGEGHGGPGFAAPEIRDMINNFFDVNLKK